VLSFIFLSNLTYRIICLLGFLAMMVRGGDRRLLAEAAAGTFAIYVVLTCVFYFVGLAYDNVSEVTRFILFMGALDSTVWGMEWAWRRLTGSAAPWLSPRTEVPAGA
jgi:hypothetical protein